MKPRAWKEKCDAHTQYLIKHALPSGKKERKKAIRVQREENKKRVASGAIMDVKKVRMVNNQNYYR